MRKTLVFFLGWLFAVAWLIGFVWFKVPFQSVVIGELGSIVLMLTGMIGKNDNYR